MNIAIISGTGFVGSAVAGRLRKRGLKTVAIARGQHPVTLPEGTIFEQADRMDAGRLLEIFRKHEIQTVIDIFALGMLNTKPVFKAMKTNGGRYLLLSSVDVYRNYGGLLKRETPPVQLDPAKETDPLRDFRHPYLGNPNRPKGIDEALFNDYDKIILEEAACAEQSFETTIIRAPMIFGPGDKQHRFAWAIEAVKAGGTIKVDERAAGWPNSYGYIIDIAEAIVMAALSPKAAGRIYNVGQPFVRTPVQWLKIVADVMDRQIDIKVVPPEAKGLVWERAEASNLRYPLTLDTSRIRAELNYAEPTPERDALHATIAAGG